MSPSITLLATAHLKGPHVDFAGLSPLIALLGGAVVVLAVGLIGSRLGARAGGAGPDPRLARSRPRADDLAVERSEVDRLGRASDRRPVARAEPRADRRRRLHGAARVALAGRARSGARRVPRTASDLDRRHVAARRRAEHRHPVRGPRASVDPAVRSLRHRDEAGAFARVGAEVPDHRLRRLGHAAVRHRDDLRRYRRDGFQRDRKRPVEREPGERSADPDRDRAVRGRPVLQGLGGAVPSVDSRRIRGSAHAGDGVHGGGHQGRRARGVPALLRRRPDRRARQLGAGARGRSPRSRSSSATSARSGSPR